MNKLIEDLQEWFRRQCDGEWENDAGVVIETTDNPGWWVKIDLTGTDLEDKPFASMSRGIVEPDPEPPWVQCFVRDGVFNGAGDPGTLQEILEIFIRWANEPSR